MPRIRYTYQRFREVLATGDARTFEFRFLRVPVARIGHPDEHSVTKETLFRVKISRTVLDGTWKLAAEDVPKVAYEIAHHALERHGATPLELTSSTAPPSCRYAPDRITFPPTEPFEIDHPIGFRA